MGRFAAVFLALLALCWFGAGEAVRAQEENAGLSGKQDGETQDTDGLLDSYAEELDLAKLQESVDEIFPALDFDLRGSLLKLAKGELPLTAQNVRQLLKDALFLELDRQKEVILQILSLAVAAAIFFNFMRVFEKSQISDIAFYMIYLMLFVILMRAYGELDRMAGDYLSRILHFMKLLLPVYLLAASLAAGSVTAAGFCELTLMAITAAQMLMTYIVLPGIRFYVLLLLINHLSREDMLSGLARLMKTVISWSLRTMLAAVAGIQTIQALLLPAIDSLKNTAWTKTAGALPVLGNTLSAVTETVLGTAVVLKNSVGIVGMLLLALLGLLPIVRLAVCTLLYKAAGAAVQPVSDRRITECIGSVGEGASLLLETVAITTVMFLLTLAMVTASVRGG